MKKHASGVIVSVSVYEGKNKVETRVFSDEKARYRWMEKMKKRYPGAEIKHRLEGFIYEE